MAEKIVDTTRDGVVDYFSYRIEKLFENNVKAGHMKSLDYEDENISRQAQSLYNDVYTSCRLYYNTRKIVDGKMWLDKDDYRAWQKERRNEVSSEFSNKIDKDKIFSFISCAEIKHISARDKVFNRYQNYVKRNNLYKSKPLRDINFLNWVEKTYDSDFAKTFVSGDAVFLFSRYKGGHASYRFFGQSHLDRQEMYNELKSSADLTHGQTFLEFLQDEFENNFSKSVDVIFSNAGKQEKIQRENTAGRDFSRRNT